MVFPQIRDINEGWMYLRSIPLLSETISVSCKKFSFQEDFRSNLCTFDFYEFIMLTHHDVHIFSELIIKWHHLMSFCRFSNLAFSLSFSFDSLCVSASALHLQSQFSN